MSLTLGLPDLPILHRIGSAQLRLELACALYARGQVGKIAGAEIAGVDFFTFQGALKERGVPSYTEEMLAEDVASLQKLFGTP